MRVPLGPLLMLWMLLSLLPMSAQAQQTYTLDIPAQPLSSALTSLADQTGVQIVFFSAVTEGMQSPALAGDYNLDQVLDALLADTDLVYRKLDENGSITIQRKTDPVPPGAGAAIAPAAALPAGSELGVEINEGPTTASVETARRGGIEEIIVTGQKREERIQDVPIAMSAFSMDDLDAQKLEGGFDLLKAVPNVTFSKSNFGGYNFSIRGIGTKAVSATTDPGVAVSFNNTTLIVNRLFEQEYFDVERVEVLRGPQGTLYGRNATAGVINVISNKPKIGVFEGDIRAEVGNYAAQRLRGMVNLPIGDELALRIAGAMTQRDGYGYNQFDGSDVDNRDLWSSRITLGWEPNERVRFNLLYERFSEDDQRVRTSKQLCKFDPGLSNIGAFQVDGNLREAFIKPATSQGCLPGSLYADSAYGTPNGSSLPYISGFLVTPTNLGAYPILPGEGGCDLERNRFSNFMPIVNLCNYTVYGGLTQSKDLRTIYSAIKPEYRTTSDIYAFDVDIQLTEELTLSSQTVYATDDYYASQDLNRFRALPGLWNDSLTGCLALRNNPGDPCDPVPRSEPGPFTLAYTDYRALTPNGIFCDPQLGCSDTLLAQDLSQADSKQFNQEIRLVSTFDGSFNFSLGANYTHFETLNDYYVFINALSLLSHTSPFLVPNFDVPGCISVTETKRECGSFYIDPNPLGQHDGEGHNYFRSANPYRLRSGGLFGEAYWQAAENVKVTAGLRLTWDQKTFTPVPSQLLLGDYRVGTVLLNPNLPEGAPVTACVSKTECQFLGTAINGRGSPAEPDIVQEWRVPTGRLGFDWKPELGFTDQTMVYAFYSRGYKGGGANPPTISAPAGLLLGTPDVSAVFEPEYVNAFEIGTKNTLWGGGVVLNASAFYYDYSGYQVSKIVNRSAANENFDATVWGLELESIFAPTPDLLFNATIGFLKSRIDNGEQSIDVMDRTQGGNQSFTTPDGRTYDEWMIIKPFVVQPSNCVAPVELVEAAMLAQNGNIDLTLFCAGGNLAGASYANSIVPGTNVRFNALTDAPNGGAGFTADLSGNELPNAPRMTFSLGGQYTFYLPMNVELTTRADFYWQDESYARVYNTEFDRLKAWTNTNFSVWAEKRDWGVRLEAYVKNVFNETPITDSFVVSDDTGLVTNVFTLDPRLIGLSITKRF